MRQPNRDSHRLQVAESEGVRGEQIESSPFQRGGQGHHPELFDSPAAALEPPRRAARTESKLKSKVESLEARLQKKDSVIAEISGVSEAEKRTWGSLSGRWVLHDVRDEVMDFVAEWPEKTEIPAKEFAAWLAIARGKFYSWKKRYGRGSEHNGKIPRDFWLESWEREAIVDFHDRDPLEGYRRPHLDDARRGGRRG